MDVQDFDARASLMQIEAMIGKAKNQLSENGHLYLVWGIVVCICALLHFFTLQYSLLQRPQQVWMLTLGAFVYQTIYLLRQGKKHLVRSYTHDMLSAVWMVFVALGGLLTYICFHYKTYTLIYPIILALYGMPTILSGVILKTKPLIAGGIACMVLSLLSTRIDAPYQLLMIAFAVVVAWIVPGIFLQRRFRAQQAGR